MYVLDPEMGRRRRALVRDKMTRSANATSEGIATTWHDVRNRARGLVASTKGLFQQEPPDDPVLRERVRAELGFLVRHPSSIEVTVQEGRVTLSGPVLADEMEQLVEPSEK